MVQHLLHQGRCPIPAALPGRPVEPRGDRSSAGEEDSNGILGRGFMASAGEDGIGAENWARLGQRAWSEDRMDEQLGQGQRRRNGTWWSCGMDLHAQETFALGPTAAAGAGCPGCCAGCLRMRFPDV